jgi:hypothetical protein
MDNYKYYLISHFRGRPSVSSKRYLILDIDLIIDRLLAVYYTNKCDIILRGD